MTLLSWLPNGVVLVLWGVGATLGFAWVAARLAVWSGYPPLPMAVRAIAVAPLVLPFAIAVLFGNLDAWYPLAYGALLLAALPGSTRRVQLGAGVAVAIISIAKLHPAPLLMWIALRAWREHGGPQARVLVAAVVAGLAIVAVSLIVGGIQPWLDYVQVVRAGAGAGLVDARNIGPVSLIGQATGLDGAALRWIQVAIVAAAAIATVFAAVRVRDPILSVGIVVTASLVVLPVTWYHYPVALMPVAAALAIRDPRSRPWIAHGARAGRRRHRVPAARVGRGRRCPVRGVAGAGARRGRSRRGGATGDGEPPRRRMTASARLRTLTADRPYLVALATLNAIFGVITAWILFPLTFGSDAEIYRRGALGIQAGFFAEDFLYPPLTGVLALPLTWASPTAAAVAMSLIGLAIVLSGIWIETTRLVRVERVLVAIAVLGFVPLVYELITGQVTMLMAAAIYPLRDRDGWRRGIAFGVMLALLPKPLLAPLLVWMLFRRPRALAAAFITVAAVTLFGIAIMGLDIYRAWIDALVGTGQITRPGNIALTALGAPALVLPLAAATLLLALWAIITDERRGFVAALAASMLAVPFTLMYAVSILLLAVRPALAVAPRATRVLAFIANPAVLVAFIAWAGAVLVSVLPWPRRGPAPAADRNELDAAANV